ncbi:MAG: response regulator transcription factor [Elusimicrobia bacterium]|nr:response regulator transcription factor [Elusimicrobiota bacterium]
MEQKKKKILIIDDEDMVRETVTLALGHAGFDAEGLGDSAQAFDAIKKGQPDLVLLDLYMPEVSGFDLCRRLKADPATQAIPIVMFTGSNETVDVISGISAGAFEYITKPIDGEALIAKIRALLGGPQPPKEKP